MIPTTFVYAGALLTIGLGIASLVMVNRDYAHRDKLSKATSLVVWIAYFLHLCVLVVAAAMSMWPLPVPGVVGIPLGVVLMAGGACMFGAGVWSMHTLSRMSGRDTSKLITSGVYRWIRNPQNVGWVLFILGVALVSRSGLAMGLSVLFWGVFVIYAPMEERYLERVFDKAYRDYRRRSHRYFGMPARSDG